LRWLERWTLGVWLFHQTDAGVAMHQAAHTQVCGGHSCVPPVAQRAAAPPALPARWGSQEAELGRRSPPPPTPLQPTSGLDSYTALNLMRTLKQARCTPLPARPACRWRTAGKRWLVRARGCALPLCPPGGCSSGRCWPGLSRFVLYIHLDRVLHAHLHSVRDFYLCRWRVTGASCSCRTTNPAQPCSPCWTAHT
jgi:hypothetical protein